MYIRLAAFTVAGMLLAGSAFAATLSTRPTAVNPTTNATECKQLFDLTKKTSEGNDVGVKAQAEIDKLMSDLQSQCDSSQFEQADRTAELIRGLVATE